MKLRGKILFIILVVTYGPAFLKIGLIYLGVIADPSDSAQHVTQLTEIAVNMLIPWWLNPLEFFADLPGLLGTVFTLAFLIFLYWLGEP